MNIEIPSDVMKILFGYGLLFIGGTMWVHGYFAICFLWIVPLGALLFVFGLAILGVDVLP